MYLGATLWNTTENVFDATFEVMLMLDLVFLYLKMLESIVKP